MNVALVVTSYVFLEPTNRARIRIKPNVLPPTIPRKAHLLPVSS